MTDRPPAVTGELVFTDPPPSRSGRLVRFHPNRAQRVVPIVLDGRHGRVYFSPIELNAGLDGLEYKLGMTVLFDPPLTALDVAVMAGGEVSP